MFLGVFDTMAMNAKSPSGVRSAEAQGNSSSCQRELSEDTQTTGQTQASNLDSAAADAEPVNRATLLAEAAQKYRENHHWVPLRLEGKSPDCMGKGWNKRTLKNAPPKFKDDDNIGILLGEQSGDLMRLDRDYPEISGVMDILWPEPTLEFGRKSALRSGRLYNCKAKSKDFNLPKSMEKHPGLPLHDGEPSLMVFQILSTGKQTMVPPSIHPESGETVVWQNENTPVALDEADVLWRVGIEAFLMTVAQFWPARGTRNEAAWSLARVLLEVLAKRYPDDEELIAVIDELVLEVAMFGGDDKESRNGKERARATLRKMRAGENTTGLPHLVELLGLPKDVTETFRKWLDVRRDNRPVVTVTSELSAVATRGEEVLREVGIPLYQRGGTLVRPVIEEVDASHGRRTKVARFVRITEACLRDKLSAAAIWEKYNAREKKMVRMSPPHEVATTILSREGEWGFLTVTGIISTPTMRPDGTILDQPGYDEVTRLLLVEPPPMPPIPAAPTRDDAVTSLTQLKDLLTEFPLVDDVSRSAALSALITPVVRGAFPVAPMHGIRAPVPGAGKSYLLDCAAAIATGQLMPVMAAGRTEEETEKRLGAAILTGQPLISIDNISLELRGDALCQIIERPVVEIRILGKSERVRVEARGTCVYCTGNNLVIVGDLCRRVLTTVLDPQMERPELREFTGSPVARILANRGAYVAAALTVCRAYIVAGRPNKAKPLASFEGWSDAVRSALMWLGEADPVESIETARRDDPERIELDELLTAWAETLGVGKRYRFTLAEVIKIIGERTPAATEFKLDWPRLHAAIQAVAARGREPADAKSLGAWMRSRKGRIVGNRRFANKSRDRGTYWWAEVKDEAGWDTEAPGQWVGASVEEREECEG